MESFARSAHPYPDILDPAAVGKVISTRLPVRRSKYNDIALKTEAQSSREWHSIGGSNFWGGTSPVGNAIALTMPDMEAARIPPMVHITELLFFVDDEIEALPAEEVDTAAIEYYKPSNPEFARSAYSTGNGVESNKVVISDSENQLLAKALLEFYRVDRERAYIIVDLIHELADVQSRAHPANECWAYFLRSRYEDVGFRVYCAFMIYANALKLDRKDIEVVDDITNPACMVVLLVNDVFSYDKEVYQLKSADAVFKNSVTFIMKERNLGVTEAKKVIMQEKVPAFEQKFLNKLDSYLFNDDPRKSDHMTLYLEAVAYMTSGNWYWSACCHRYCDYKATRMVPSDASNEEVVAPSSIENGGVEIYGNAPTESLHLEISPKAVETVHINGNEAFAPSNLHSDAVGVKSFDIGSNTEARLLTLFEDHVNISAQCRLKV